MQVLEEQALFRARSRVFHQILHIMSEHMQQTLQERVMDHKHHLQQQRQFPQFLQAQLQALRQHPLPVTEILPQQAVPILLRV